MAIGSRGGAVDPLHGRRFDTGGSRFVHGFASRALDASPPVIALVGILPAGDECMRGAVAAVRPEPVRDDIVLHHGEAGTPCDQRPGLRDDAGPPAGECAPSARRQAGGVAPTVSHIAPGATAVTLAGGAAPDERRH